MRTMTNTKKPAAAALASTYPGPCLWGVSRVYVARQAAELIDVSVDWKSKTRTAFVRFGVRALR